MRLTFVILASLPLVAFAAPTLKSQAELVADGRFKLKVLANAKGVPAPTPQAQFFVKTTTSPTGGTQKETIKKYDEKELAYSEELLGMWRDKKGNEMRLAKKDKYPWGEGVTYFTTKKIGEETYYIDFKFAEKVTEAQAKKLLKTAASSLSNRTGGMSGNHSSDKWWERETEAYLFKTDLHKAKGDKFIKDTMRLMDAMRQSYEYYVPPQQDVKKCIVRVFSSLQNYREYRAATGDNDQMSAGLWDPSREELLVCGQERDMAYRIMRHEAFHQYLHYATGRGDHAMWFNEGHACFFEDVRYNPAKGTVKILENERRAQLVAKNPAYYANRIKQTLKLGHSEFYSNNPADNYVTAWAIVFFLEKGAYAHKDYEPYRKIVPKYLELTGQGVSADAATTQAWAEVSDRDIAADFLTFWKSHRKGALKARQF